MNDFDANVSIPCDILKYTYKFSQYQWLRSAIKLSIKLCTKLKLLQSKLKLYITPFLAALIRTVTIRTQPREKYANLLFNSLYVEMTRLFYGRIKNLFD